MSSSNQLPHLINSIPKDVVAYQTSFYPVALEAWRRGLKLKYHNTKRGGRIPSTSITYSLSDGNNEYHFVCGRGTKTTKEGISLAENKSTAYEHMKAKGVPIPETRTFDFEESTIDEMCDYGESIGYPLVVKPTNRGGGKGVITHISSREALKEAILKDKKDYNLQHIIIEKYFENGVDYRIFVMEDEVIAVYKNYSSNVVGDGESNIEQLIKERNIEIRNNVASKNRIIIIDDDMKEFLEENNKSLDCIPEKDERVFLRKHGTYLSTRLSVECTNTIDLKFKKYAVDALNSIPGLPTGSIDMIINEETNEGIVNEINTKGEIKAHIFPVEGQAIDIPKYIMDYYFPDSKKINDNFYFEYKPVKDLFINGYADEITIPMHPEGTQYTQSIVIEGKRLGPLYLKKLKKKAGNLHLKGSIKPISKEKIEVNVIGKRNKLNSFESFIGESDTQKTKILKIKPTEVEKFKGVSSIGLEIVEEGPLRSSEIKIDSVRKENEKIINELEEKENNYSKKINEQELEINQLIEELKNIQNSSSWKATQPLRTIKSKLKK